MAIEPKWWSWKTLRPIVIQGVLVTAIFIGIILLLAAIDREYGDYPPVSVTSLDPRDLGEACPGDEIPFHNKIQIDSVTVVLYDLSTMDTKRVFNYLGTQTRYQGLPHPVAPVTFDQVVPWHVPFLPPGTYTRVFTARGHETSEKPVSAWSYYTIKEKCNEYQRPEGSRRSLGNYVASPWDWTPSRVFLD